MRPIVRAARSPMSIALMLAALSASGMLFLSACGKSESPTSPTSPTDPGSCSGVQVSTAPCDESETGVMLPDSLPCPTRADIEAVQRVIPVTVKSDASAGTVVCREQDGSLDLTRNQERTYQALLLLRRLRFDAPLPWTDKTVYDWLRAAIPKGIVIDSTGNSHSCIRCSGPIYIVFQPGDWNPNIPTSVALTPFSGIVHEARHADGWPHTCHYTAANGYVGDKTIAEMGAFGVQYYLFDWIANHSDEDYLFKAAARGNAAGMRHSAFCCECGGGHWSSVSLAQVLALFNSPQWTPLVAARNCSRGGTGVQTPRSLF